MEGEEKGVREGKEGVRKKERGGKGWESVLLALILQFDHWAKKWMLKFLRVYKKCRILYYCKKRCVEWGVRRIGRTDRLFFIYFISSLYIFAYLVTSLVAVIKAITIVDQRNLGSPRNRHHTPHRYLLWCQTAKTTKLSVPDCQFRQPPPPMKIAVSLFYYNKWTLCSSRTATQSDHVP